MDTRVPQRRMFLLVIAVAMMVGRSAAEVTGAYSGNDEEYEQQDVCLRTDDEECQGECSEAATHSDEYDFEIDGCGGCDEPKKTKRSKVAAANGGLPNFASDEYDHDYWSCKVVGRGKNFVEMVDTVHGGEYNVPKTRVNKALRFLHLPTVAAALQAHKGFCRCKRTPQCNMHWTTYTVLQYRHSFFQQVSERDATKYLADLVKPYNTKTASATSDSAPSKKQNRQTFKWVLNGVEVCDEAFANVFGISKSKMGKVRDLLRDENKELPPPPTRPERPRVKYTQCKTFWKCFFKNCQRPNAHTRLFPVNASYPCIYEDYFEPWFKQTLPDSVDDMPCLGWLNAARHDEEFKDVKNRPKHHHCRCETCANLQARRLQAFNSAYEQNQFQLEWHDHEEEKRGWREFEEGLVLAARHSPHMYNVFWFDDTETMGWPKWTKRPMKNLPTARFGMIPFLVADLARSKDYYIYTAKNRFKKGANRLCTSLLTTIRATKAEDHPARLARSLTFIADNFSENKNNTLLAFASYLVMLGWYDTVDFYYGPVGHTHNGGDQQHQIHNEVLGNFTSPTPVHSFAR